jgi:hypothetical protein
MLYVHVLLTIGTTQGTIRTIASLNNKCTIGRLSSDDILPWWNGDY